jgi:hypothetical protein
MTLDSSGNVGIGVTPSSGAGILQIQAPKTFAAGIPQGNLVIADSTAQATGVGGAINLLGKYLDNGTITSFASIEASKENGTSGQFGAALVFKTRENGGNQNEGMRIDSTGNVLINQSSSNLTYGKLQVSAGGETAGFGGIVAFFDTDGSVASSNLIQLLSFSGDTDATGGQFIRFRDSNSVMGSVSAASGTTVSYNTSSDRRMKENIVDASSQLDVINNIQVREFDWKINGHHEVGMIAQELNEVIPNVVQEGGDDVTEEAWGIDYGKLTPYLIKAVQEQQTIIDDLKSRIETLEG